MFMPASAGLFQRAILQSGPCLPIPYLSLEKQLLQGDYRHYPRMIRVQRKMSALALHISDITGDNFTERIGCANQTDVVSCLYSKSADDVQNAYPEGPLPFISPGT
jgi:hypothetical protein